MISIDVLVGQTVGLSRSDLERWIRNEWVRPDSVAGILTFREIDVARVTLIQELRHDLEVDEAALPIVLSLLDQVYDLRRHLRQLGEVIEETMPADVRARLLQVLVTRNR